MDKQKLQELGLAVINTEAQAVADLADKVMSDTFIHACQLMLDCKGRVVVTGDVNFCDNSYIAHGDNELFSLNAFTWLAETNDPTAVTEGTWGAVKALYK